MRAVSTYVKLCIAAAYNKLNAGIAYVKLTPQVSYVKLQATTAYIKLCAAASYTLLGASVQYVLLKAAAITGQFIAYLEFFETVTPTDTNTISVSKSLTDNLDLEDQISASFASSKEDSVSASDIANLTAGLNKTDSVDLQDQVSDIVVGKELNDNVPTVDVHSTAFSKFLADVVTPSDTLAGIVFTDEEDDSVIVDDFPVTDDPELTIGKNLLETTITSDAGVLRMQDYCDITYFLEDYVGISRTF